MLANKAIMNKSDLLSDLWNDTLKGDVSAFESIHRELYPLLLHYLSKIIQDDDVCQDILQDLFIKMWERKEKFGQIKNVKVYFFKAARSMALNYIKTNKQHDPLNDDHQYIDIVFCQEEILVDAERNKEAAFVLSSALNTLPERQREMIFLKYFDGWNYDQIADVTGIKYQSVVNHVHRAVTQLRTVLSSDEQLLRCQPVS
ncbi:RNA polymerase sigma factor [Mucilaginibacter sp. AW1-3]